MKSFVRLVTAICYKYVVKPILFRYSPDDVHAGLVRLGIRVQTTPLARSLPGLWLASDERLSQSLLGMTFSNPVGLAAGFDKNIELLPLMRSVGFGFMTGGSVTAGSYDGNPRPWFHRLPKSSSLIVHAGLPNKGIETVASTLGAYKQTQTSGFPLIVSVAKTNSAATADESHAIDDYCQSLVRLETVSNVQMYEINISCPNTFGGEPFTSPDSLERLLTKIDELHLARPIVIKMPIDTSWQEFDELLGVIVQHQVSGVTIGNLLKDRSRAALQDEFDQNIPGGLSGRPTRDIATVLIQQTYQKYGDRLVIIGVGGVFSAHDAYEKICAGASLVELITGLIYVGPQLVGDINSELVSLLGADGFHNVSQAIGSRAGV